MEVDDLLVRAFEAQNVTRRRIETHTRTGRRREKKACQKNEAVQEPKPRKTSRVERRSVREKAIVPR